MHLGNKSNIEQQLAFDLMIQRWLGNEESKGNNNFILIASSHLLVYHQLFSFQFYRGDKFCPKNTRITKNFNPVQRNVINSILQKSKCVEFHIIHLALNQKVQFFTSKFKHIVHWSSLWLQTHHKSYLQILNDAAKVQSKSPQKGFYHFFFYIPKLEVNKIVLSTTL